MELTRGSAATIAITVMTLLMCVNLVSLSPATCNTVCAEEDTACETVAVLQAAAADSMQIAEQDLGELLSDVTEPAEETSVTEAADVRPIDVVAFGDPVEPGDTDGRDGRGNCGGKGASPHHEGAPDGHRGPRDAADSRDEPITDAHFAEGGQGPGMQAAVSEHPPQKEHTDGCPPEPTSYKPSEKPSDTVAPGHPPEYSVDPEFEKNVIDPMQDSGRYGEITKTERYSLTYAVVEYLNQLSQDMQTGYAPDDRRDEEVPEETAADTEYFTTEEESDEEEETFYQVTAEPFIPLTDFPMPFVKVGPGIVQA